MEGLYFVSPDITSPLCSTKHLQRPKIAQRQRQTKENRPEFHIVNRTLRRLSFHIGRASLLLFKYMNRHIHNSVLPTVWVHQLPILVYIHFINIYFRQNNRVYCCLTVCIVVVDLCVLLSYVYLLYYVYFFFLL